MAEAIKGYRRKPSWAILAGLAFILAPLGNLIWSLMALKVEQWYNPRVWLIWAQQIEPKIWAMMALVFISGVALLFVRRWAWILALVSLGAVALYTLLMLKQLSSALGWEIIVLMMVATLCTIGVFLFSPFRLPYLNPRLRWWETSPRYKADIEVEMKQHGVKANLVDISRTGALVEWSEKKNIEMDTVEELVFPGNITILCEKARSTPTGCGLKFVQMTAQSKKDLKNLIEQLGKDPTALNR